MAKAEGLSFDEFWDRAVPPAETLRHKRTKKPLLDEHGDEKQKPSRTLPRVGAKVAPDGAVLWPRDTRERRDSYEAAIAARDVWRRAYEGIPATSRERALIRLRPFLERLTAAAEDEDPEGSPGGSPSRPAVPLPA